MNDPLTTARAALAEYDLEAARRDPSKVPPPRAEHLRAAIAAYDDAAEGLDKWRHYCEGARATVARLDATLAALRIEHEARGALLDVTRGERDRLREAAWAVVAAWDLPVDEPGAMSVEIMAIDGLRDALAGRGGG